MLEIRAIGKKSRCLHSKYMYVISLTSNHNFVHFNHYDTFYSDNKGCEQRFIEFADENFKPKVQIGDQFIYMMN